MDDTPASFEVCSEYNGEAIVETYTIAPNKTGAVATIIARTSDDERVAAMVNEDQEDVMKQLMDDRAIGMRVHISHQGSGLHHFSFA